MWLHFGFGRIGKAAIAQFFDDNKKVITEAVMVDRNYDGYHKVEVAIKSGECVKKIKDINIANIETILKQKYNKTMFISTSVTTPSIRHILNDVNKLVKLSTHEKIVIIPFENDVRAFEEIKNFFKGNNKVVVLQSMIDMIVSNLTKDYVIAENHYNLKIDKKIKTFIELPERYISENIEDEHKIKFYLVNGIHACAAYLGLFWGGFKTIDEVVTSSEWKGVQPEIKKDYVEYVSAKFGKTQKVVGEYFDLTIERFHQELGDTLERVGRNPHLKIKKNERMEPIKSVKTWSMIKIGSEKLGKQ